MRPVDVQWSGKQFPLAQCQACAFVFTQTPPREEDCQHFYDVEDYSPHRTDASGWMMVVWLTRLLFRRPAQRRWMKKYAGRPPGSLLDIGCGTGDFLRCMQRDGWQVRGIETNADARDYCRTRRLTVDDQSILQSLPDASFDVVTLWMVLEHVYDIHATAATIRRLLKPGGVAFVSVPNHQSFQAERYGEEWSAYDVPKHVSHFSPETMRRLVEAHELRIVTIKPLVLDEFYIALHSQTSELRGLPRAIIDGVGYAFAGYRFPERASSVTYVLRIAAEANTPGSLSF